MIRLEKKYAEKKEERKRGKEERREESLGLVLNRSSNLFHAEKNTSPRDGAPAGDLGGGAGARGLCCAQDE